MISLLPWLDFIGIAVAAASGALAAARKNMDLGGFAFTSAAAGLAGGTMRDLLLNRPVLWIERPSFLVVCLATAFVLFFAAHHLQSRERYYLWADALALGGAEMVELLSSLTDALKPTEIRRLATLLNRMIEHRGL